MRCFLLLLLLASSLAPVSVHAQGALEPTAPPAPVMKTLDQVEPRTPIDSAGTISTPGSYYLTGNINGPLVISANDVDLDLQGFTITGTSNFALEISSAINVRVHNGTVREAINSSIKLQSSSNAVLENLRVLDATLDAIRVDDHSGLLIIRSSLIDTAGFAGIRVANTGEASMEAVIEDNVVKNANTITSSSRQGISVFHNGSGGLTVSIARNRVFNNRRTGIAVTVSGTGPSSGFVSNNHIYGNGTTGLFVLGDFLVSKNIAHANGSNYNLASAPNAAPVSTLASAGPWDNVGQ